MLSLGGCDSEEPSRNEGASAPSPIAPVAPQKKKEDPLDLAIAAQEGYVYNPIGKRDPFRAFLALIRLASKAQSGPIYVIPNIFGKNIFSIFFYFQAFWLVALVC